MVLQSNFLFAQLNQSESITKHVDSLNWESFSIAYTYFAHLKISDNAEALKNLDEKQVAVQLFNSLDIEFKTVFSHMIFS